MVKASSLFFLKKNLGRTCENLAGFLVKKSGCKLLIADFLNEIGEKSYACKTESEQFHNANKYNLILLFGAFILRRFLWSYYRVC